MWGQVDRMQLSNDLAITHNRDGVWRRDVALSQLYDLDEVIDALYVNGQFQLPKNQKLQAGLRYEYTRTDLGEPGQPRWFVDATEAFFRVYSGQRT